MACQKLLIIAVSIFITSLEGQTQIITTFAGIYKQHGYTGDHGQALNAQIDPWDLVFDPDGNMYMMDGWNNVIRKIDTNGIITTFAGNGTLGYSGDGGPATAAALRLAGLASDAAGNIYLSDDYHGVIRKIDRTGIITTIAGNGTNGYSGDGGPAMNARLNPGSLAVDKKGNIYVSDLHFARIRKIDQNGIITTFAGNGTSQFYGQDENIPATTSPVSPMGLATDDTGNVYVACSSNRIRKINPAGIITTVAGNKAFSYSGDGGPATLASLGHCMDVAIDPMGNIVIADCNNHRIRKVNRSGIISTIAGTGVEGYSGDNGPGPKAEISFPVAIATDRDGAVYFSEAGNFVIRKILACKTPPVVTVTINAAAASVCAGEAVTFTATPVNGGDTPSYQWQVNGKNEGDDNVIFTTDQLQPGDLVNCMLISSITCTEPVASNTLAIQVNQAPVIDMEEEITILPGTNVQLQPQITGTIAKYQWSPTIGLSDPAIASPFASPTNTTSYKLSITSEKGCSTAKDITVVVYKKILLPNAFTPNADNKNDIFRIPAGTSFTLKDFRIYNRWGGIVFKTTNINEGWNGKTNNQPAPAGLYVYAISGTDQRKEVIVKGTVLLLR